MIVLYLAGSLAFRVHYHTEGAPFFARFLREAWEAVRSHHGHCHTFLGEAGLAKVTEWEVLKMKIRPPAA